MKFECGRFIVNYESICFSVSEIRAVYIYLPCFFVYNEAISMIIILIVVLSKCAL